MTFVHVRVSLHSTRLFAAVRDREDAVERHINDSLAMLPALEAHIESEKEAHARIIDVGSGAGFPGAILAIAKPEWKVGSCLSRADVTATKESALMIARLQCGYILCTCMMRFMWYRGDRQTCRVLAGDSVGFPRETLRFCPEDCH